MWSILFWRERFVGNSGKNAGPEGGKYVVEGGRRGGVGGKVTLQLRVEVRVMDQGS